MFSSRKLHAKLRKARECPAGAELLAAAREPGMAPGLQTSNFGEGKARFGVARGMSSRLPARACRLDTFAFLPDRERRNWRKRRLGRTSAGDRSRLALPFTIFEQIGAASRLIIKFTCADYRRRKFEALENYLFFVVCSIPVTVKSLTEAKGFVRERCGRPCLRVRQINFLFTGAPRSGETKKLSYNNWKNC